MLGIAFCVTEEPKDKETTKQLGHELRVEYTHFEYFPESGFFLNGCFLFNLDFKFSIHKDYYIYYSIQEDKTELDVLAIFNIKNHIRVMCKFIL